METLVVASQHRNQFYGRGRVSARNRCGYGFRFGSGSGTPTSGLFREINCRSFESGAGILPTPLKSRITRAFSASFSPKTPSSLVRVNSYSEYQNKPKKAIRSSSFSPKTPSHSSSRHVNSYSDDQKKSKKPTRSSSIAIPINLKVENDYRKEDCFTDGFHFSELWAGPAYSNSPPPSSLPMPKFSVKPKRSVSLVLPSSASDIDLPSTAKSAPASPTRERSPSPGLLFDSTDSATQILRRILNLEVTDG